jgi:glycosyltransferase involved in cell wall biosynthesis
LTVAAPPQPRILFAIGGLGRGGSETQLTRLLENLPQPITHTGVLLQDGTASDYLPRVAALGVELHIAPHHPRLWRPIRIALRVGFAARSVYRFRPDLIYAWLEESALYLVPLGRMFGIPVVVARRNVSGSAMEQRSGLVRFTQRRLERTATLVTANSEAVARVAADRGVALERIRVVPNGHEPLPALPFPRGEELVIGYLANYRPEKGHAMMMEVLARLVGRPGWRVIFGGRGPLAGELRGRAADAGVGDRVEFVTVQDTRAFWASCHVAVLLSDHEGSPNALIEAAFAGRPIIATAVGGSPEVVGEGAGVLVAPGDVAGAAAAIECMNSDRDMLAEMGKHAWAHAARRFTIERMVEGHIHALREAHATRPRPKVRWRARATDRPW